jgi:hypothetical protein
VSHKLQYGCEKDHHALSPTTLLWSQLEALGWSERDDVKTSGTGFDCDNSEVNEGSDLDDLAGLNYIICQRLTLEQSGQSASCYPFQILPLPPGSDSGRFSALMMDRIK